MIKKIACVMLALFMMLSTTIAANGGFIYSSQYAPSEDSVELNWFSKDQWEIIEGIRDIKTRNTSSSKLLYIISDKQADRMAIESVFEDGVDLSAYNEIAVEFIVSDGVECTYKITYYYDGGSFSDSVKSDAGSRNIAYFRLPSEKSDSIKKIEISVYSDNNDLNYFAVSSFSADSNRTYSYGQIYQSRRIYSESSNVNYYDDHVEVVSKKSEGSLICELLEDFEKESALVVVELDSSYTGIVTLENLSTDQSYSTAMYAGIAKYSFLLSDLEKNMKFSFSEGDASKNMSVKLLSLKVVQIPEEEKALGTVESCMYENGKLIIKGTVDSEATIEYIDSVIAVYKVPYNYNGENLKTPVIEANLSTFYEIEFPVSYDYTQYKYVVALKNRKTIVPVSSPVYAVSKPTLDHLSQGCDVGLHDVGNAAFFESEAEKIVIDVYTNKLFVSVDEIAAIRYTYRDNVYYINSEYANELSASASFITSVGGKVYFRVLSSESGKFDFNINRISSVGEMCAAAGYIGSHFENIEGVIALSGFSYKNNFTENVKQASELLGLFVSSFRSQNRNAEIFVSISEGYEHIAPLLARYNELSCIEDVGVVYECTKQSRAANEIKALCDSAALFGSSFRSSILFWKVDKSNATSGVFNWLYERAEQKNVSCVVFSIGDSMTTDEISDVLAGLYADDYLRYEFEAFKSDIEFRGQYKLWDFTQSYNTFGWLAGGACSMPETAKSVFNDKRVIRSSFTPTDDKEGILVGWFEGVTDLSAADVLIVDLAVDGNKIGEIPVSIVLGGNGIRAEYNTEIGSGESSINLNLSSFPQSNRVEYIAVIANSSFNATFEIYDLSIVSNTLSDDELKATVTSETDNYGGNTNLYVFFVGVVMSAIVVFIALSKKKTVKQNNG